MAITRKERLKTIMPSLNKLFSDEYSKWSERKVYEVIRRGDTFDVLEHSVNEPDDIVVAQGLTDKELDAMLKLLPDDSLIENNSERNQRNGL